MRSDVLAAVFAFILLAIRLIVLSLQGLMSQSNFVVCTCLAVVFWGAMRPSTDVITDLGYIRASSSSNRLVKIKKEESPTYYALILIISWVAAIALAIFMFSVDLSGMEFTRVK